MAELSERVKRQIDRLLDEADKAIELRDWPKVLVLVGDVLALDPDNGDAQTYLAAAERAGAKPEPASPAASAPTASGDPLSPTLPRQGGGSFVAFPLRGGSQPPARAIAKVGRGGVPQRRPGDFGLAMALDRSRLTQAGMMVGTVAYMAPEQALGTEVTARSDLYALGALLYELVCGRPPFVGEDSVAIITQHLNTPPVAPSWHVPDLPPGLETLILHLLEKDPSKGPLQRLRCVRCWRLSNRATRFHPMRQATSRDRQPALPALARATRLRAASNPR